MIVNQGKRPWYLELHLRHCGVHVNHGCWGVHDVDGEPSFIEWLKRNGVPLDPASDGNQDGWLEFFSSCGASNPDELYEAYTMGFNAQGGKPVAEHLLHALTVAARSNGHQHIKDVRLRLLTSALVKCFGGIQHAHATPQVRQWILMLFDWRVTNFCHNTTTVKSHA